jgi:hypothetical protein
MHSWSIFDAQTSHRHTRIHKIQHGLDLGEATTFPLQQCCKELFNQMSFDPYNYSLKIRKSNGIPTFRVGSPLGSVGSFLHTLLHSREHEM